MCCFWKDDVNDQQPFQGFLSTPAIKKLSRGGGPFLRGKSSLAGKQNA